MNLLLNSMIVAMITSIACSLPGVFLVLRGTTMVSDAVTHTVLLGIVIAFFIVQDLSSPFLLIGATVVGLITVWLIEALNRTKLLSLDASIGVVFPFLFSIAIILINLYASHVHLDVDIVLTGEIGFTPFHRLVLLGQDLGPQAFWKMLIIAGIDLGIITLFYKELKVTSFDPEYAQTIGINPTVFHYLLMSMVSLTAVAAFEVAGSVLVVGFMVGPALAGYLLFNDLKRILLSSAVISVINSIIGVYLAYQLDTTFNGMIAVVTGLTTLLIILFSPKKGILTSN